MIQKITEDIWFTPYFKETDRPNLGYVRGSDASVMVDSGNSPAHTAEYLSELERKGLPFPSYVFLTHHHWDHTFGMHAVNGLCLANVKTNKYLSEWKEKIIILAC